MSYQMLLYYPLFVWMLATTCLAQAQTQSPTAGLSDNAPGPVFKRLHDYVGSSPVEFQTSFDIRSDIFGAVLKGTTRVLLRLPNLFRMSTSTAHSSYVLNTDGKVLTIYDPRIRQFAQVPAPSSVQGAVRLFAGLRSVAPTVLNFFGMVDDVAAGANDIQVAARGAGAVGGRQCDRFTIKKGEDRWLVWLEKTDIPLPCKFVKSNTNDVGDIVQTYEFSWKPNPVFSPEAFRFSPPKGSKLAT
jgi:hypothetical protein